MDGRAAERFFLYSQLASCPWAGWYVRLTGDERTARQFERVRKLLLVGLNAPPSVGQQAPVEPPAYQQLSLL